MAQMASSSSAALLARPLRSSARPTKRGRHYVDQLIGQSVVIFLWALNMVFLAQSCNVNRDFAHESHLQYICKPLFHPPEIKGATNEYDHRDHGRDDRHCTRRCVGAQQAPNETPRRRRPLD